MPVPPVMFTSKVASGLSAPPIMVLALKVRVPEPVSISKLSVVAASPSPLIVEVNVIVPSCVEPGSVSRATVPEITTGPVNVILLLAASEVVIFPDNVIPVAWLLVS